MKQTRFWIVVALVSACGLGSPNQQETNNGTSNWSISDANSNAPIWTGQAAGPTIDSNYVSVSIPSSPSMSLDIHYPNTTGGQSYTCETGGSVTLNTSTGAFQAGGGTPGPGTDCTITVSTIPATGPALVPGSMNGTLGFCGKPAGCLDPDWTLYHIQGTFNAFRP